MEGPRQTGKTFIMKEFSKSYHVCEDDAVVESCI